MTVRRLARRTPTVIHGPGGAAGGSHPRASATAMKTQEAVMSTLTAVAPRAPKRRAAARATTA